MADLLEIYNERKYGKSGIGDIFEPITGLAETAIGGLAYVPKTVASILYGIYQATKKGNIEEYPKAFTESQEALTYEPRSVVGKDIARGLGYVAEKGRRVADWLGEEVTGGDPTATLVSAGIRGLGAAAGLAAPLVGGAFLRSAAAKEASSQAAKLASHKSTLAALAAGEKLRLGAGESVVYARGTRPSTSLVNVERDAFQKDFFVPAQETALGVVEDRMINSRDNSAPTPSWSEAMERNRELMEKSKPKLELTKKRPTIDDFKVLSDTDNAQISRKVLRMDSEENAENRPHGFSDQTRVEQVSSSNIPQTIKVVDEPSYEKIRNESLEKPSAVLEKNTLPKSIDLLERKTRSYTKPKSKIDLLSNVVNKTTSVKKSDIPIPTKELLKKPIRNISDIKTPEGFERPEYLGEDESGNYITASKGRSGHRITGLGSSLEESFQDLQSKLDQAPISKARIKKITSKPVESTEGALSETKVDNIIKQMGVYDKERQASKFGDKIPRDNRLSPTHKLIEAKLISKIKKNLPQAMDWYKSNWGKDINVDFIRNYSDDYSASPDSRALLSRAVHEPSSWLGKKIYAHELSQPVSEGKLPRVLLTAGGTGAGKSSSLKLPGFNRIKNDADISYDSNMDNFESGRTRIDQALESGRSVDILYTYRDPIEAFENGTLRLREGGRSVPLSSHISTHLGSREVIQEIADHYQSNPNVRIHVFDNSKGKGKTVLSTLEDLPKQSYTKESLRSILYDTLEKARTKGTISESTYLGTIGQDVRERPGSLLEGVIGRQERLLTSADRSSQLESERFEQKLDFESAKAEANKPLVLGTQLNAGFDIAKGVWYTLQTAKAKLKDAFLRPEPGVKIHETKDLNARLRWRDWVISPTKVAQAQKSFKVLGDLGDRYIVDHNKLIMRNGKALETVDKIIKKTEDSHINREKLDNLLLFGDIEGKYFTRQELTEMGIPKEVQQAYGLIRKTLDLNHRLINIVRKKSGQEPIGYLKGYVSHNLKDWHILHDNKIIGSSPTFYDAVSQANAAKRGGLPGELHIIPRGYKKSQEGFSKVADDALKKFEDDFLDQMHFNEKDIAPNIGNVSQRHREFNNLLKRKGNSTVIGSIDTTLREYLNNSSRYIAASRFKLDAYNSFKKEFGENITANFPKSSVADYARNYVNDITGGQVYLDKFVNDMFSGGESSFGRWVTKYVGKDVVGAFAKGGGDLTNMVYIGANISSALLNYASMIYGGAILGHGRLLKTWTETKLHGLNKTHKEKIMRQIGVSKYSPQLEAFPSSELTKTGLLHKILYKTFSAADYDVKSNIGYAAYKKAIEEGTPHSKALKYARQVVVNSVGEMSYSDAPAIVRMAGKIGRPFWQLKRTLHKGVENALSFRGKEAVRFWGPFLALAGYHGIPFIEDIMNLISWTTNGEVDPELAMKETLMTWAKENEDKKGVARLVNVGSTVAQYGLLGSMANLDISRRVGLSDLTSSLGRPAFQSVVSDVWKPAVEGDWADAAFRLLPRAGVKAGQYFLARNELFKSPYERGRLTLIEPTWGEETAKAVGYTPLRERQAIETGQIEARHKRVQQRSEAELIDDYIEAREGDDQEGMDAIRQEAMEQDVSNFMKRVQAEYRRKQEGKSARTKRLAGRKRKEAIEAYSQ